MTLEKAETKNYIKAIRLINTENNDCTFDIGKIPIRQHINTGYFFAQTDTSLQYSSHPAP